MTAYDPKQSFNDMVKGTLRRRLSHGYFSFIAKYTSKSVANVSPVTPPNYYIKGAGPNFVA